MAITATWTTEKRERLGKRTRVTGQFSLTGSATAGGFAISASTFGLNVLDDFTVSGGAISATGGTNAFMPIYDKAAGKITIFEGGGTANDNPFDEADIGSTAGYLIRGSAWGT